ncbi:hypothetical protein BDF14DRAFT_1874116 [Spinellus fusiger]|nr:hypothetical protein BDF14DRAFT_1874116 [Spinellus fusiger]
MVLRSRSLKAVIFMTVAVSLSNAFYLPGVAPQDYKAGDTVPLYVNSLTPMSNQQVKSVLSYDYYFERFHFCQPSDGPKKQSESIGSVLFGDRIFTSPFQLSMMKNQTCQLLCQVESLPIADAEFINDRIIDNYAVNWVVDGLPAAHENIDRNTGEIYYNIGFNLGHVEGHSPYINNHYDINVYYHERPSSKYRVVGVVVRPSSQLTQLGADGAPVCNRSNAPVYLKADGNDKIVYTYSIYWHRSSTSWATRWDNYLHILDPSIHWFSLVNSIVIVLFLTGMVAMILLRALHKDISRYNAVEAHEDVQEDYGWKLVHGDVFRPPVHHPMLLSVSVGSGTQLIAMTALTLVFAVLGFLSPSNRGSLATVMVVFFMVFSCISGFTSSRLYKMNGGESWKLNILLNATLFPGIIFGFMFGLNFFLIGSDASGAVPFGTMLALVGLWMLISLPLSTMGSYYGLRKPRIEQPVRTNQIPRQIPDQPIYLRSLSTIFMGGILPFGAIFIEIYYIMNSIWFHRIYYGIGFLFLVFGVLLLTCSQVTVLMCYFHLCNEDYHWSWRAFFTAGATGAYVLLYSVMYYMTKLDINSFTSTVLYFGYSMLISILLATLTGAVGYLSCLVFLRKIFDSIKVD